MILILTETEASIATEGAFRRENAKGKGSSALSDLFHDTVGSVLFGQIERWIFMEQ